MRISTLHRETRVRTPLSAGSNRMPLLLCICLVSLTGIRSPAQERNVEALEVVASVDISRYVGTWYEIARLPNRFQEKCAGDVTATYSVLGDDEIKVVNRCRKENGEITEAAGVARRASDLEPNTKLKVRFAPAFLSFLPFVWGDYWIIDLAPDYTYAVIGEPDRRYLWILSRSQNMDEGLLNQILVRVRTRGYDTSALIKTTHLK